MQKQKSLKNRISPLFFRDFFRLAASYFRFDTIVGVQWLNFCVRDGNRCDPLAVATILQRIAYVCYVEDCLRLVIAVLISSCYCSSILSHGSFKNKHQLRHNCGYSYWMTFVIVSFHSYWKRSSLASLPSRYLRLSFRPISTGQLHFSRNFHTQPISL